MPGVSLSVNAATGNLRIVNSIESYPTKMNKDHNTDQQAPENVGRQLLKLALELGPLVIFFMSNSWGGIHFATKVFMAATLVAIAASRLIFGRVAIMPLVTAVFVMIFGGLTVWLANDLFIKLKPTIVNLFFASALFGGLLARHSLLKYVFGEAFHLTEEGWQVLTRRWAVFFVVLAALNEIVWRNFSTDSWVAFKTFGIMPLTMVFAISQFGLIKRHELTPADKTHEEH